MLKFIVLDEVLTTSERKSIVNYCYNNSNYVNNMDWYKIESATDWQLKLIDIASNYFELNDMIGIESWAHMNSRPDWHIDQDEWAFSKGIIERPICSIVFYPFVDLVDGGDFVTEDKKISPKTNRALIFSPGIKHKVDAWNGQRISVAINPWNIIPFSYRNA